MLSTLYIENIAVIEKTNIDFTLGMNVLTGETGAGKSIIIDAINAVLGHRTSKEIIRSTENHAFVSAEFCDISEYAKRKAQSLGFEIEDNALIISRELSLSGKNSCRINGRPATVSQLKELSSYLITIHGQSDNAQLTNPSVHMRYIDELCDFHPLLSEYRQVYSKLVEVNKQLSNENTDEAYRLSQIDLLSFQVSELENAGITVGETDALNSERSVLRNSEQIAKSLLKARACFESEQDSTGVLEMLSDIESNLSAAAKYLEEIEPLYNRLSDCAYELDDIHSEIVSCLDDIGSDPSRLDEIEQRLDFLYRLQKKYGSSEQDMLDYLDSARQKLAEYQNYDNNKKQLQMQYDKLLNKAETLAEKLSQKRKTCAMDFSRNVADELSFLQMPGVRLAVEFEKTELTKNGFDKLEFLISANPGEDPKPVSKIASGGELSRMMLAIKTVLSRCDFTDTLIFDEIDTGISGLAAQKVGMKLKEVSKSRQVMCVTHQAQIAAIADSHYLISKSVENGRTYTSVQRLEHNDRVQELARIIGGIEISQTALDHASKLLEDNNTQ